jgi:hypothetical protein
MAMSPNVVGLASTIRDWQPVHRTLRYDRERCRAHPRIVDQPERGGDLDGAVVALGGVGEENEFHVGEFGSPVCRCGA